MKKTTKISGKLEGGFMLSFKLKFMTKMNKYKTIVKLYR